MLWGVSTFVFLMLHIIPGDPVDLMLGETAEPADKVTLRSALGLDRPLPLQYGRFLWHLAQGDLGRSLHTQRRVLETILGRLPATAELAAASLLLALALALPLGTCAAVRQGSWLNLGSMGFALLGVSIPHFWLGPMLILLFAVARAKGLPERLVLGRHALKNASIPLITLLGRQLGALLSGAIITETVFAWPGIGRLIVEAIQRRDYPMVQGCVLVIATGYVCINCLTDLAYAWVDLRIKYR